MTGAVVPLLLSSYCCIRRFTNFFVSEATLFDSCRVQMLNVADVDATDPSIEGFSGLIDQQFCLAPWRG